MIEAPSSVIVASLTLATLLGLLLLPPSRAMADTPPVVATPPAVAAVAAEPPPGDRPGFTASLGLGYAYGLLGLQVRYDRPLRPWLHLAPFVAGGIYSGFGWHSMLGAVGLSTGLGWRHRLAVDVAVAPVDFDELNLHGTRVDHRTIYGPNLAAGYEHFSAEGWLQRITLGYGWAEWGSGAAPFRSGVTLSIGSGRRIW